MTRKTTAIILIVITSVSQTSCTWFFRVFIRNFTDRPVELKFHRDNETSYQNDLYFGYKDDLVKINQETLKYLDKKTTLEIDRKEVTLTIPPRSTISIIPFLSSDTVTLETQIEKLGIKNGRQGILVQDGEVKDSLDIANFGQEIKFKRKGGLLVKTLYYYDYGRPNAR
jgi:hypothetical protein